MPGRLYADEVTVNPQNVETASVTVRPSIAADDPSLGLYQTWAAAHAAIALVEAIRKIIYIDAAGVIVTIGAGAFDMTRIAIVGFPTAGSGAVGLQQLTTVAGTTFTNWTEGCEGCSIEHNGAAALCSYGQVAPNALRIRTGKNSRFRSTGNLAPFFLLTGSGGLFIDVEEGSTFVADGAGDYEIVELTAGEIEMRFFDNVELSNDWLRGGAAFTVNQLFVGVRPELTTNANFAGTNAYFQGADGLFYEAAPADWVGAPPTTVGAAIDRIAAALGPIA